MRRKTLRGINIRKGEANCDYLQMTLLLTYKNLRKSIDKLLELIREFSKVTTYKSNLKKINSFPIYQQ